MPLALQALSLDSEVSDDIPITETDKTSSKILKAVTVWSTFAVNMSLFRQHSDLRDTRLLLMAIINKLTFSLFIIVSMKNVNCNDASSFRFPCGCDLRFSFCDHDACSWKHSYPHAMHYFISILRSLTSPCARRVAIPAVGAHRNLHVHEYISMKIMQEHDIATPEGYVASTPEEAENIFTRMFGTGK